MQWERNSRDGEWRDAHIYHLKSVPLKNQMQKGDESCVQYRAEWDCELGLAYG